MSIPVFGASDLELGNKTKVDKKNEAYLKTQTNI
jgi:hypothetical protein